MNSKGRRESREFTYVMFTLYAFVFAPELRRLFEWQGHFASIDFISPLPLVALLPVAYWAIKYRSHVRSDAFTIVLAVWLVAFGYAFVIGVLQREILTGLYGLAEFVLPAITGLWLLSLEMPSARILYRLRKTILLLGALVGIYGVIQFVIAPPWDVAWMLEVDAGSFGNPVPFEIRTFSVLNSPGVCAQFLFASLVLAIPVIDLRRWWSWIAVSFVLTSLILTSVQVAWIEAGLALAIMLLLHPRRVQSFAKLAMIGGTLALALATFFATLPSEETRQNISQRIDTFGSLGEDGSAADRQANAAGVLASALNELQGVGLGLTGQSNKLASQSHLQFLYEPHPAIDNGYLSRLYEMGLFGLAAFLSSLVLTVIYLLGRYLTAARERDGQTMEQCALAIAFCIATFVGEAGGDNLAGVSEELFFLAFASALYTVGRRAEKASPRARFAKPATSR